MAAKTDRLKETWSHMFVLQADILSLIEQSELSKWHIWESIVGLQNGWHSTREGGVYIDWMPENKRPSVPHLLRHTSNGRSVSAGGGW